MTDTNHSNPDDPTRGMVKVQAVAAKIETQEEIREHHMPVQAHPYSWPQFARDFLMLIQVVALAYVARSSNTVESNQAEVKQTLEVKAESDAKATRTLLWNAYTQLLWRAEETGSQKDKDRAVEAKRVYDDWVKLTGNGG